MPPRGTKVTAHRVLTSLLLPHQLTSLLLLHCRLLLVVGSLGKRCIIGLLASEGGLELEGRWFLRRCAGLYL